MFSLRWQRVKKLFKLSTIIADVFETGELVASFQKSKNVCWLCVKSVLYFTKFHQENIDLNFFSIHAFKIVEDRLNFFQIFTRGYNIIFAAGRDALSFQYLRSRYKMIDLIL